MSNKKIEPFIIPKSRIYENGFMKSELRFDVSNYLNFKVNDSNLKISIIQELNICKLAKQLSMFNCI